MENDLYRDEEFTLENLNELHCFEALDRCHMLQTHLENALFNHMGVSDNEARLLNQVSILLADVYQSLGQRAFKEHGDPEAPGF